MDTVDELIKQLSDRNTKTRLEAANKLGQMKEALESISKLMSNPDFTIRRVAAYILGKIGSESSVEVLVEALGDDNPDVRKSAAQALNRIGKPAIDLLIRALGNISKDVRASAVWAISKMGEIAVQPLIDVLNSEVKDVRASAVWALSKLGDISIKPLLDKMLDSEKNVRESAIWGLSKIGEPAIRAVAEKFNVRIGKDAKDGEKETDSVDLDDLLQNGESAIKNWVKFLVDKKITPEKPAEGATTPNAETPTSTEPSETSSEPKDSETPQ